MAEAVRTADLDRSFGKEPHLRLVPPVKLNDGGVDPLGLRQLNLDLMDHALPGINNVTAHIRPYTLMSWAWWKAAKAAEAGGKTSVDAAWLQDTVDRLEVLFAWSHFLADDAAGIPGRNVLKDKLPRPGSARTYNFAGPDWDRLRQDRRRSTAFMAPIQYGPSIKSLGWLVPTPEGAFHPSTQAIKAVEALDALVSGSLPPRVFTPGQVAIEPDEALTLHAAWTLRAPTEAERLAFRHLFHEIGRGMADDAPQARRRASLDLALVVLRQSQGSLTLEAVRRAMASGHAADGSPLDLPSSLVPTQLHWAAMQARQLQRLALESLLRWIETRIDDGGASSENLADDAEAAARETEDGADAATLGSYLDLVTARADGHGWPAACGLAGEADIFAVMAELQEAQWEEGCPRVPGLALRALAMADAMTVALRSKGSLSAETGPLGGQADRLPLLLARKRLHAARDRSLKGLWLEMVEAWVIGQHVRWSVVRNGDGTQRLRIALGDRGWIRLRKGLSGPFGPTPDRLSTALALSSACGLIRRTSDPDEEATYSAVT